MHSSLSFFVFRESWKRNQAVKHVFSWMLVQVERPCLTEYLEKVFPPSLLISDDYRTENKVLGVHCLHHIVLNVVSKYFLVNILSTTTIYKKLVRAESFHAKKKKKFHNLNLPTEQQNTAS